MKVKSPLHSLGKCVGRQRGAIGWVPIFAVLLVFWLARAESASLLNATQQEKLARLIQTDSDAANRFNKLKRLADASLSDTPHPVKSIATAGKLASDAAKVESRAALEDMKKLEAFGFAFTVTSNATYAAAAKRTILSWAQTYEPSGSPIDETKLEPLFTAYGLVERTFAPAEKKTVETWLRLIAEQEWAKMRPRSVTASNNWHSHRLKIIGLIGFVLADRALIDRAVSGFKQQIENNLRPDGSSLDFHERDALHYHCYDLEPLLTLAITAHQHGVELYDYQSPSGASLRKSVQFLVPYCNGTATHAEWVNSHVAFDRQRAAAGEAKFKAGTLFDPEDGLRALQLAAYFDEGLNPLVGRLARHEASAVFPVWQSVLNEAMRP